MDRTFTRTFLRRAAITLLLAVMTMTATAVSAIQGTVQTCEGGAGYIHVSGWAYYAEDTDEAIDVLIMVYSDESMKNQYRIADLQLTTNMLSSGINGTYGISGNHGFNAYLFIGEGTYWVRVGAIYKSHTSRTIYTGEQSVTVAASGAMTLTDGAVLSGTGGADTHVTIADGATVTLMGVNITDITDDGSHRWAGITCAGDATIILADGTTNSVMGGYVDYPGIYIPENKTLTIRGGGTLNASSNGWGAGIGGGHNKGCGSIVIDGGIINATGGYNEAGIGGGFGASCGDITITTGITSLTATKGEEAPYSIGAGYQGTCGTVTIGGIETGGVEQSPYTVELFTVSFDANGGMGTMAAQAFLKGFEQSLNANTFTAPAEMAFNCWNTEADGTGTEYSNLESITVSGNTTLYAQWRSKTIDLSLISPNYIGDKTIIPSFKDVRVSDGDILTGMASRYIHISIASGATVTLRNANIAPTAEVDGLSPFPAIDLIGNATIILEGYNYLEGGYKTPNLTGSTGIRCLRGNTLTIRGNGSLEVRSGSAAGIGGDVNRPYGNIVIEGSVTSIAAYGLPAIGGGGSGSGTVTVASSLRDLSYDRGHTRIILNSSLPLSDASSNSYLLGLYNGQGNISATLQDRTLYKDGAWNTLCLPFAMTAQQVSAQLAPAALMTLGSSTFSGGTLTLNFTDATEIEAGQPYIIRWNKPNGYDGHEAEHDILSPTFTGVTVSKTTAPVETQYVDFVGITSPVTLAANDRSVLYLGSGNQLYWPSDDRPVNAFRAYFHLGNGLTCGTPTSAVRAFSLNFGDQETTGIVDIEHGTLNMEHSADAGWYDLSGRKLSGKPTAKGLYIHNGKKRIIK